LVPDWIGNGVDRWLFTATAVSTLNLTEMPDVRGVKMRAVLQVELDFAAGYLGT